jgi:hypothetical protein
MKGVRDAQHRLHLVAGAGLIVTSRHQLFNGRDDAFGPLYAIKVFAMQVFKHRAHDHGCVVENGHVDVDLAPTEQIDGRQAAMAEAELDIAIALASAERAQQAVGFDRLGKAIDGPATPAGLTVVVAADALALGLDRSPGEELEEGVGANICDGDATDSHRNCSVYNFWRQKWRNDIARLPGFPSMVARS